jgi:hypothetical protein
MKSSLLIFILAFSNIILAQNKEFNPFQSIGKEGKILTLSKGKYTEVHINDSLQQIGSVIVNMNSGMIYDILDTDTLYNESNLDPTVITRWYSPDPVVKHHESPYASMANSPIWVVDPNGADSALANGGTTWQWHVEPGNTYSEISKRTGVSIADLEKWNGDAAKRIPIGKMLHISNPSAAAPETAADMQTSCGVITRRVLEANSVPDNGGAKLWVGITFIPNEANKDSEFIWYQTVGSNDPLEEMPPKGDPARATRPLRSSDNLYYKDDQISGLTNGYKFANKELVPNHTVFISPPGATPFFDGPSRPYHATGTSEWHGYLQVMKKVNSTYVIVGTIKYGFTMYNNVLTPSLFEFNPAINANDQDTQYQNKQFQIWDAIH